MILPLRELGGFCQPGQKSLLKSKTMQKKCCKISSKPRCLHATDGGKLMTSASLPPSKSLASVSHWQNIKWNLTVKRRKKLQFPGYLGKSRQERWNFETEWE